MTTKEKLDLINEHANHMATDDAYDTLYDNNMETRLLTLYEVAKSVKRDFFDMISYDDLAQMFTEFEKAEGENTNE